MKYRKGYKYQLAADFSMKVAMTPVNNIETQFIDLSPVGELVIRSGYAWDGASGGMFDTDNVMIASLVHDALYQLLRQGKIAQSEKNRGKADDVFYTLCRKAGMSTFRAWYAREALRKFGGAAASREGKKEVFEII